MKKLILKFLLAFLLFSPLAGAENYCLNGNTAGAWKVDEASGNLVDCTSNGNTGTVTGTFTYSQTVKWDGAIDSNNVNNNIVSFGSGASLDNIWDGGGTLMFWAELDSAGNNGGIVCDGSNFFSKDLTAGDGWNSCINQARTLVFSSKWAGGNVVWTTNSALFASFDGNPHFYMIYYNSDSTSNVPEIQLDCGGSIGVTQGATAPFTSRNSDAAYNLNAFIDGSGGTGELDGRMDDILLYGGDLRSQCSTIMAAGLDGTHGKAVALTGTVTSTTYASDIRAGGKTIILTLTSETWVASGGTFDAQRQAIINGLTSASSETNGWNNEVKAKIAVTDVVRTSATVVTITLDAEAGYDTVSPETITVTVPAAALTGAGALVATPTFTVIPNPRLNVGTDFSVNTQFQM